jgi:uncharacterized membrane protein
MNRTLTGTLLALASAGGYAFFSIFAKLAYRAGVAVFDVLTWRFILAAAIIWLAFPLWRKRARLHQITRQDALTLLLMGVLFAFAAWVAFVALARVPATTYTMLFYTYPAMVALISLALGERLPLTSWLAIGLGLIGCALAAGARIEVGSFWDISLPLINAATIARPKRPRSDLRCCSHHSIVCDFHHCCAFPGPGGAPLTGRVDGHAGAVGSINYHRDRCTPGRDYLHRRVARDSSEHGWPASDGHPGSRPAG